MRCEYLECQERDCGDYLPLLILNLSLHVIDCVGGFHLQGDGLSGQCLDENLHGWSTIREVRMKCCGWFKDERSERPRTMALSLLYPTELSLNCGVAVSRATGYIISRVGRSQNIRPSAVRLTRTRHAVPQCLIYF